jgi:tyrosyl-tRNA synthetase
MPLFEELEARGLVHDATDRAALAARLEAGPVTLYYGCDPTADSLHVGNLVGLVTLRRFQVAGHRPIALAGGATGMIGDPSGRSDERNLLDEETLARNLVRIEDQIRRILGDDGGWLLVDNASWTRDVRLLDFLRDVGKHFTVNQMVAKDSVRLRMQSTEGISFTEFSYMLLQANDFLQLYDRFGCELQIGGSDQWGNITAGIELIRRCRRVGVHGFTWPLVVRSDGRKFGKTEAGETPWLAADRFSPYRFYQFWMNVPDADVGRMLRLFSFRALEEIDDLVAEAAAAPERRLGQRALAREVTALVHGEEAAAAAEGASAVLFGGPARAASAAALAQVAGEVPTTAVPRHRLDEGLDLVAVLAEVGLASSLSDARRQVAQGAAYVNDERAGEGRRLGPADLLHGRYVVLRRGKKAYHVLVADPSPGV